MVATAMAVRYGKRIRRTAHAGAQKAALGHRGQFRTDFRAPPRAFGTVHYARLPYRIVLKERYRARGKIPRTDKTGYDRGLSRASRSRVRRVATLVR